MGWLVVLAYWSPPRCCILLMANELAARKQEEIHEVSCRNTRPKEDDGRDEGDYSSPRMKHTWLHVTSSDWLDG